MVRDSNINTRGDIFNKSKLLAFADDMGIIARTSTALRQALFLEKETFRIWNTHWYRIIASIRPGLQNVGSAN
ncbi:hypothetical protein TNCV_4696601 [Trichonephila clavipes]|nr:hypothetical protein TNCV_4696601 [Trichonephila clavipes]